MTYTPPKRTAVPMPVVSKPTIPAVTAHRLMNLVPLWLKEPVGEGRYTLQRFTRATFIQRLIEDQALTQNAARMFFERLVERHVLEEAPTPGGSSTLYSVTTWTVVDLYKEYDFVPVYGTLAECTKVIQRLLQVDGLALYVFGGGEAQKDVWDSLIPHVNELRDGLHNLKDGLPDPTPTLARIIEAFEIHMVLKFEENLGDGYGFHAKCLNYLMGGA